MPDGKTHKKARKLVYAIIVEKFGEMSPEQHVAVKKVLNEYIEETTGVYRIEIKNISNALKQKNEYITKVLGRKSPKKHGDIKKTLKKI